LDGGDTFARTARAPYAKCTSLADRMAVTSPSAGARERTARRPGVAVVLDRILEAALLTPGVGFS
jgi:hypothetical protein